MTQIDFEYLVDRHGDGMAWQLLEEIEKAAGLRPRRDIPDPQARLTHACRLQDKKAAMAAFNADHRSRKMAA